VWCWDGPRNTVGTGTKLGWSQDRFTVDKMPGMGPSQDYSGTVPGQSQDGTGNVLGLSWDCVIVYMIDGTGTVSGPSQDWDGSGTGPGWYERLKYKVLLA